MLLHTKIILLDNVSGIDDRLDESFFTYGDRSEMSSYNEWAPGSPVKGDNGENKDCVIMDPKMAYRWNNINCMESHYMICQL